MIRIVLAAIAVLAWFTRSWPGDWEYDSDNWFGDWNWGDGDRDCDNGSCSD